MPPLTLPSVAIRAGHPWPRKRSGREGLEDGVQMVLNREEDSWPEVPSGSRAKGVSGPVLLGFEEKEGVWGRGKQTRWSTEEF